MCVFLLSLPLSFFYFLLSSTFFFLYACFFLSLVFPTIRYDLIRFHNGNSLIPVQQRGQPPKDEEPENNADTVPKRL